MKTANKVLMEQALNTLSGKWKLAVSTFLVYLLISVGIQVIPVLGIIAGLILAGPLTLGLSNFSLSFSRNQNAQLEQLFESFDRFRIALTAYITIIVYVVLWLLLLIVPGILAALSYSQTFFILADDNSISARDAMNKSKAMMKGKRYDLFCLGCRFIGWGLLCIITLGIGLLWLIPYMHISFAKFYDDLKNNTAVVEPLSS